MLDLLQHPKAVAFVLLLLQLILRRILARKNRSNLPLPPGPKGYICIGNLLLARYYTKDVKPILKFLIVNGAVGIAVPQLRNSMPDAPGLDGEPRLYLIKLMTPSNSHFTGVLIGTVLMMLVTTL